MFHAVGLAEGEELGSNILQADIDAVFLGSAGSFASSTARGGTCARPRLPLIDALFAATQKFTVASRPRNLTDAFASETAEIPPWVKY
jgi:hypothetical protein